MSLQFAYQLLGMLKFLEGVWENTFRVSTELQQITRAEALKLHASRQSALPRHTNESCSGKHIAEKLFQQFHGNMLCREKVLTFSAMHFAAHTYWFYFLSKIISGEEI